MKRIDVIEEIKKCGYDAEEIDIVKNGVVKSGIKFKTDTNISPVVYLEDFIGMNSTAWEIARECIKVVNASNKNVGFNTEWLTDAIFIKEHAYIGFQKSSDEEIIKSETDFEGIEKYVYLRLNLNNGMGAVKVTPQILSLSGLSEETLFFFGEENTIEETKTINLGDVFGMPDFGAEIITNKDQIKGASAILNKDALRWFANKYHVNKIIIIPSSIHECILLPYTDDADTDFLDGVIRMINAEEVKPEERLSNRVYTIEV